ncbi:MAG TPA: prepilin peptidase [Methylocella sp.]|nr:prepilin peptidase [Methylocella sp.]
MLEAATLFIFPALMVFAGLSDLLTMTIPNRVSIAIALLFVAMAFACGLPTAVILRHLACGALMLVLTFFMFARGWIGGGDAKLAAATAIWLGFDHIGDYAVSASVLGCLLTLIIIGLRKWPSPSLGMTSRWAMCLLDPGSGIPYGVALASAGLILYPGTAIWLGAAALH